VHWPPLISWMSCGFRWFFCGMPSSLTVGVGCPCRPAEDLGVPPLVLQMAPPSIKVNPPESLANMQPAVTRQANSGTKGALAPSSFYCPISMELMGDPCMLATGHTYERVGGPSACACAAVLWTGPSSRHILALSPLSKSW